MASYVIMRSCGHEEKVFVDGGYKNNEWRLERMKQEPEDKLAAILESDREVIEDLKDE